MQTKNAYSAAVQLCKQARDGHSGAHKFSSFRSKYAIAAYGINDRVTLTTMMCGVRAAVLLAEGERIPATIKQHDSGITSIATKTTSARMAREPLAKG